MRRRPAQRRAQQSRQVAGNCPGHAWAAFLKRRAGHESWPQAPRAHTAVHTCTWRWDSDRAWRAWGASAIQVCHIVAAHHAPFPQKPAPCSLRSAGRNVRLIITSRSGARASQRSVVLSPPQRADEALHMLAGNLRPTEHACLAARYKWTRWELSVGHLACRAGVLSLQHMPTCNTCRLAP